MHAGPLELTSLQLGFALQQRNGSSPGYERTKGLWLRTGRFPFRSSNFTKSRSGIVGERGLRAGTTPSKAVTLRPRMSKGYVLDGMAVAIQATKSCCTNHSHQCLHNRYGRVRQGTSSSAKQCLPTMGHCCQSPLVLLAHHWPTIGPPLAHCFAQQSPTWPTLTMGYKAGPVPRLASWKHLRSHSDG